MGAMANIAMSAAAVIGGASDQYSQGKSIRAQGDYSARVSDQNAVLADAEAADAISRGQTMESRIRGQTGALLGAEKVSYAGQGVDVNSGSAADVMTDTTRLGELDALTARTNAAREAHGFTVQAAQDRAAGNLARTAANNEADAMTAGAATTLLTGGARVANMWQQNKPTFGRSPSVTTRRPTGFAGSA